MKDLQIYYRPEVKLGTYPQRYFIKRGDLFYGEELSGTFDNNHRCIKEQFNGTGSDFASNVFVQFKKNFSYHKNHDRKEEFVKEFIQTYKGFLKLFNKADWVKDFEAFNILEKVDAVWAKYLLKVDADSNCLTWLDQYDLKKYISTIFGDNNITRVFDFCVKNFESKIPAGKKQKFFNMKVTDIFAHNKFIDFLKKELPSYFNFAGLLVLDEQLTAKFQALKLSEQF